MMIDGLVYGEDPRQGYLDKSNFVFYHPEMKFEYPIPRDWQFQIHRRPFRQPTKKAPQQLF
jgi:predicted Zn-dependent protease